MPRTGRTRTRGATRRLQRVGAIEIDTAAREVRVAGALVDLSAMEFALLTTLATDPRRVSSKDELLAARRLGLPGARPHADAGIARLPAAPQAL